MPRGSKRKSKTKNKSGFKIGSMAFLFMLLCLASIWKSNSVKDHYEQMISLEKTKGELVKENLHLKAKLSDVKSLDKISKAAGKIGLTYDVADRLFIKDPVAIGKNISRRDFVDADDKILNNLEDFMFRSGPALAGDGKKRGNK